MEMTASEPPWVKNESDESLFIYMAAGDDVEQQAAFGEFYCRYQNYIWFVCARWCATHIRPLHEAEDLVVDACYLIFKKAEKFQPLETDDSEYQSHRIKAWIGTVIKNYLCGQYRGSESVNTVSLDTEVCTEESQPELNQETEPRSRLLHLVEEALSELSERDQDVVRAVIGEKDLSRIAARGKQGTTQALADELNMTAAGVRQRYKRALGKIEAYVLTRINLE
jgi:RNA polymerase sigma factor (sigma-70 family)